MKWLVKIPVALGFFAVAVVSVMAAGTWAPPAAGWIARWPLLAGLAGGLTMGASRRLAGFYRTLEHELTHVLFALLCLRRPQHLVATADRGGEAGYAGRRNFVISLAPYFFPLTAVVLLLLALISVESWRSWMVVGMVVGMVVAIGYHLSAVFGELRMGQPDLQHHGTPFSAAVIVGLVAPILSLLLSYALFGARGFSLWAEAWLRAARTAIDWANGRAG